MKRKKKISVNGLRHLKLLTNLTELQVSNFGDNRGAFILALKPLMNLITLGLSDDVHFTDDAYREHASFSELVSFPRLRALL